MVLVSCHSEAHMGRYKSVARISVFIAEFAHVQYHPVPKQLVGHCGRLVVAGSDRREAKIVGLACAR